MYCSGCGTRITAGLNYCSRCGRRVAEEKKSAKQDASNPLIIAGNTAAFGFVAFIFVLLVLTRSGATPNLIVPIVFFYFAALFGICLMIGRQRKTEQRFEGPAARSTESEEPSYLRPITTAQLEEPNEMGVGSITEHTTRTLDEVAVRRK